MADPVTEYHFAGLFHFLALPALHCDLALSASTDGDDAGFARRTVSFVALPATRVFASRLRSWAGFPTCRDAVRAFLSRLGHKVNKWCLSARAMRNKLGRAGAW